MSPLPPDDAEWLEQVGSGLPAPPDGVAQLLVPLSVYRYSAALLGLADLLAADLQVEPREALAIAVELLRQPATSAGVTADLARAMDRLAQAEEEEGDG